MTDCILWTGRVGSHGYGVHNNHKLAHRTALETKLGRSLRPKEYALHHCDVRLCVNPDHLFPGTQKDNVADMYAKGRDRHRVPVGEAHTQAKLTVVDVAAIRASRESQRRLAQRYGVSQSTIWRVQRRVTWRTA